MFQEPEFSLKRDIALVVAVEAAGFKLTNNKSVRTEDGYAWHATLVHGRTKVVTAFNGGTGGDDQTDFHATTDVAKAADGARLQELFRISEVVDLLRKDALYNLHMRMQFNKPSDADYFAAKDQIASTMPALTVDRVAYLIGHLATAFMLANQIKRALKTKLAFVLQGEDALAEYRWYKVSDTPANRAAAQQKKDGKIDYFLADLFGSTNESKGA